MNTATNNAAVTLSAGIADIRVTGDESIEALKENIGYFRDDLSELLRTIETELPEVEKRKADTRVKIVQLMHGIRMKIEDRERELLKQNEQHFTASLDELNACLATSRTLAKEVDDIKTKTEEALKYGAVGGDHNPLNHEYRIAQTKFFEIQDRLTCPKLTVLDEDEVVLNALRFAEISNQPLIQKETYCENEDTDNSENLPEFDFCCRTPRDQKDPFITGMTWINKKIVIADKSNQKVKFFLENEDFLHEILFSVGEPYAGVCFTKMNANNVETYAVTIPKAKMLYFVDMAANGISQPKVGRSLNTPIGYSGISCFGKELIVTAVNVDFPRVDIIDFNGGNLRSFAIDASRRPLFAFPRYVTIDVGACIVSDWKQNKITIMREQDGAIFGTYSGTPQNPVKDPYDVTVDGNGYIFIMDGKSGMIHVVDRNYRLVQLIQDTKNLLSPRLLAYDSHTGYLAVTYAASSVKCIPAPSAVQRYQSSSRHEERRVSGVSDAMTLSVPSGAQHRSPSPGF